MSRMSALRDCLVVSTKFTLLGPDLSYWVLISHVLSYLALFLVGTGLSLQVTVTH